MRPSGIERRPLVSLLRRRSYQAGAAIPCMAVLLAGCSALDRDRPATVSSPDQAASLEITPASIEPWATAAPALTPNFTMSGDAALAKVLPTTERVTRESVQAFEGSLAVGLPQSSSTSSVTRTQNSTLPAAATDSTTTQQTNTSTTAPGVVPTIAAGAPAGAGLPTAASVSGDLGNDPVVAYRAANYLNQIVQLFNRELQAAPQRRCYAPYLVKLKLAVMPYRSRLPYALHTRIGFFENDEPGARAALDTDPPHPPSSDNPIEQARRKAVAAAEDARASVNLAKGFADRAASAAASSELSARTAKGLPAVSITEAERAAARAGTVATCLNDTVPMVLPLIAADDMQVALKSKAVEVAQQLGVALSLMVHGVGANVGAKNLRQSLDAVLSHDLSSSLTVTRSNENTLYLRIAPNNEPSGEPALVGQSYDIAVLLLVPIGYLHAAADPRVKFDVVTEYRDARTGAILHTANETHRAAELDRVLQPFMSAQGFHRWTRLRPETRLYVGRELSTAAVGLSIPAMESFIGCLPGDRPIDTAVVPKDYDQERIERGCVASIEQHQARYLLTALGAYIADSPFKSGLIDVPHPVDIGLPQQTVIVSDNGTSAASAMLSGVRGGASSRLQGYLDLTVKNGGGTRRIPATSSTIDPVAHTLTLTFPSPATFKTDAESWEDKGNKLSIEPICDDEREWCPAMLGGRYVSEEDVRVVNRPGDVAGTSKVALTATTGFIVYEGGTGSVSLTVAKLAGSETATLSVSGGTLAGATDSVSGALAITGDGAIEPKNGYVTLTLTNLTGDPVKVTAIAKAGAKQTGSAFANFSLKAKPKAAGDK